LGESPVIQWMCRERQGMAIVNPCAVTVLPLTPEMAAELERLAAEAGMSVEDYLNQVEEEPPPAC